MLLFFPWKSRWSRAERSQCVSQSSQCYLWHLSFVSRAVKRCSSQSGFTQNLTLSNFFLQNCGLLCIKKLYKPQTTCEINCTLRTLPRNNCSPDWLSVMKVHILGPMERQQTGGTLPFCLHTLGSVAAFMSAVTVHSFWSQPWGLPLQVFFCRPLS